MSIHGINGSLNAYQAQIQAQQAQASRTQQAGVQRPATDGKSPAGATQGQASQDRINVSADGALRTAALSTAMNTNDVRQEKVDSIRESLDNGTYVIDSRKIATKLVQDENAIFGR